ncbi:MAG: hypothetical protein GX595_19980, partial [Lentisphaerae bacterium]|nr:hypothetical protein [Lentisphaerota bacterium]
FNHGTKFQEVIDGVLDLTFTSYTTAMAPQSSWLGAAVETALPYAVDVRLTLLDTKTLARWKLLSAADQAKLENEAALTFSKMIFLGGRQ